MKESTKNKSLFFLVLHIAAICMITLVVLLLIVPNQSGSNNFAQGFVLVIALGFIYAVAAKYVRPKADGKTEHGNPYHNFFFRGTAVLTMILTLLGIVGAFFVYVEHDNLFQAVGLVVSIIWIGAFLMYFMWAVYHYNINYGLTDQDWEKIFEAEERDRQGFPVKPSELDAPKNNPYRSQTFGLPPGTVRGMIAFTLLIGGMSLLIVSFGTEYTGAELALVRQQFEFFETAFLMMIAFYFGDKSLRYLQKRWRDPNLPQTGGSTSPKKGGNPDDKRGLGLTPDSSGPKDPVFLDDQEFLKEEIEFSEINDTPPSSSLDTSRTHDPVLRKPAITINKGVEYVQIMDNLHHKVLSDEAIKDALEELKTVDQITLSLPVVKAIISVESSGRGHLQDGKAKILFEGHKFWKWLEKAGKDPEALQRDNANIIYKNWTSKNYLKGSGEYKRLEAAKKIDEKAAIYSASWGLFQILGENLEHYIKSRSYKDVLDFEEKQHESEYYHFLDFLAFIKAKEVRGKPLIQYISEENNGNYDWKTFAYGYNGSGYEVNQYDIKLKAAFDKYKLEETQRQTGWIPIIDAGHGGLVNGQYATPGKHYTFNDGTVIYEGVVNRSIGRLLADKLKKAGIPYLQTTLDTEMDIDLDERVRLANTYYQRHRNCYLLSIHSNAATNEVVGAGNDANGFEIYTSIGKTKSDELAMVASKWYKKMFPDFEFREHKTEGGEYQNKEASFVVLAKTHCPAFLVENLFYDNVIESKFLLSDDGQKRIAECLFQIVKEIYQKVQV
jgi:N-acetylmuramoyl-L-alanine amidase